MYQECLKLVFKSVSRVLKGSFMGVSIVFVFIEFITATQAYGGLVFIIGKTYLRKFTMMVITYLKKFPMMLKSNSQS